ncbi:MAG TPA: polysaccharide biosynthesis tyrosine autokinase [Humisphaera sp.]|nr:polysaccharide biosynthesis tyrosine autokinase [Humisphaera sp.]
MTTLPQTSPMRAPRVGTNGHLAMPVMHGPAPVPSHSMTGADVWRVIRANIWLILSTLVIAAIVGFLANMWLLARHSRYTSVGLLQVRTPGEIPHRLMQDGVGADPATLEIESRTHAKRLTHEALISTVLEQSEPVRQTEWFNQFITYKDGKHVPDVQAAKQDMMDHLDVIPQPQSRLLEVSMTYSVPKDARIIVQALCDEYLSQVKRQQNLDQDERMKNLSDMVNSYESEISKWTRMRDEDAKELGANGVGINGSNLKMWELQYLQDQEKEYRGHFNEYDFKLKNFKIELANNSSYEMYKALSGDSELYNLKILERQYKVEAEALADRGRESEVAKSAQARLDRYKAERQDLEAQLNAQNSAAIENEYQAAVQGNKKSMEEVEKKIEGLEKVISDLATKQLQYMNHQKLLEYFTDKRDKVKDEMDQLGTVRSSSRFNPIEWAQQPNTPDHPSFPKLWLVLSATMTLGLALSLGIAFLREMTDTTVRSPRDIARVGQMTLLGMIPHEANDPQVAAGRLALAIFDSPHSIIAEQFRHVRTRLQHAASLDTTRSILVSGCSPEDGKTTVACNIAAGLALNGRRILLVDANFRRPQLHTVFAVSNESGFGDVLNNAEVFAQSVRETEVPNLSVMPSGNRPSNPTELLESQLLVDFIERALEEYDHVIFDSGPLLMVSDSIALAPRVDGVITVIRARGNSRGLLQRVRDELRRLKAEHLGVVLNAVRVQGGGYYGPMIKNYYAYQNR